jgi:hypothetical protein
MGGNPPTERAKVYDFTMGVYDVPGNASNLWQFQRFQSPAPVGNNESFTSLNPSDRTIGIAAAIVIAADTISSEPGYIAGAYVATKALHQQATYRWAAVRSDQRIINPAVLNQGFGIITPVCGSPGLMAAVELYFTI